MNDKLIKKIIYEWNNSWSEDIYESNKSTWKPEDDKKIEAITTILETYKKLKKRVQEAEGEVTIIRGIGMNSPEFRALKKENEELKDDNRKLAQQIQDKNNLVGRLRDKGFI